MKPQDPAELETQEALRRAADLLAKILDTAIPIPGTRIRFGVDPIIGLLPGVGDTIASLVGSAILVMAARLHVPRIIVARMSLNIFLNGAVGAVPVVGDLFSFWFRSNARNAELLRRHSSPSRRPSTAADWGFVIGMVLATLAVTIGTLLVILWGIARLWGLVQ